MSRIVREKQLAHAGVFLYLHRQELLFSGKDLQPGKGRSAPWANKVPVLQWAIPNQGQEGALMCVQATQISDGLFHFWVVSYLYTVAVCHTSKVQFRPLLPWTQRPTASESFPPGSYWAQHSRRCHGKGNGAARSMCTPAFFSGQGRSTREDILGRSSSSSHEWSLWRPFLQGI